MRVRLQRQLGLPVGAPHARPLHLDASAAERHLARLVPVPHRDPIRIVLALGAHDFDDLFFQQLGQYSKADTDAQREQALLRRADQLPERLLHARRQHDFLHARLRERYVPIHGGSLL